MSPRLGWRAVLWRVSPLLLIFDTWPSSWDIANLRRPKDFALTRRGHTDRCFPASRDAGIDNLEEESRKIEQKAQRHGEAVCGSVRSRGGEQLGGLCEDVLFETEDIVRLDESDADYQMQKVILLRPWRLLFGEMVVSLSCAYLGFVYAVFYMLVPQPPDSTPSPPVLTRHQASATLPPHFRRYLRIHPRNVRRSIYHT